ncbi:MAG: SUMF1/EgtB/PvdO family nonheme iron enzyme [Thiomargarita sp.]|nr:SUMF1/EgtB/PvdO family nonheme iron enzyme [Thiomargarita sp.]
MILTKSRSVLPIGYQLKEYRIQAVLGHGGFGITYLAQDTKLNYRVAIKEYFPTDLAVREEKHHVQAKFQKYKQNFLWGLERFLKEGQALATFQHPNIVRVLRYFEAHNTAYIVMEYEQGQSLSNALKSGAILTEDEIIAILPLLLAGLQAVHENGFLHRDIKPGNIYLRDKDNTPVLLDFGAARYALGNRSRSITALVTPGYTPFEQYQTKGDLGAWTDIYAVGAVLYRAISGHKPVESPTRINVVKLNNEKDPLKPIIQIGRKNYSKRLLQGIDWALQISEKDRPQTVKDWADMMLPKSYHSFHSNKSNLSTTINKNTVNIWSISIFLLITLFHLGYFLYGQHFISQWQQQLSIEKENLTAEISLKKLHLARLEAEESALDIVLANSAKQLNAISNSKDIQEQLIAKLNQKISFKEIQLIELEAKITQAGVKIPGNIIRDALKDGSLGPEMVVIPSGEFQMGDIQANGYSDELPIHSIAINHFTIGRYEITFEQYDYFAEATGRNKPDDNSWGRNNRPVINVSVVDAMDYADWLSEQTGYHYRLPTESEWEYTARADTKTDYWWGNRAGENQAVCKNCGSQWDNKKTAPVGSLLPNQFGLYDTVGNVWEWTCSIYHSQYTGQEQQCAINFDGDKLVIRGGAWYNNIENSRVASRNWIDATTQFYGFGFRLVRVKN